MLVGLVLLSLGVGAYVSSALLTASYLSRRAPGQLEASRDLPPGPGGKRLWELSAGTGLVPRWVSMLGILAWPLTLVGLVLIAVNIF